MNDNLTNTNKECCKLTDFVKNFICKLKEKKPLVNVINLDGIIGSTGVKQGLTIQSLNSSIEKAFEGKNLKAVIININSPGGSPVQSELISNRIKKLSLEKNIPVIAIVEDMAASGGYWLACSANEIVAAENSILGSLGVRFSGFGFNKLIEKYGIERRIHTKGESKALLDPFLPEKEEDINVILKVQEDIYQNFKKHVLNHRKDKLKINDKDLFSGAIWSATQSLEMGLIDKIGNLYQEVSERFGDKTIIKIVNEEKSWLKKKLSIVLNLENFLSELKTYNHF